MPKVRLCRSVPLAVIALGATALVLVGGLAAAEPAGRSAPAVGTMAVHPSPGHPRAVPVQGSGGATPALYTSHYWAGAYFTGTSTHTHQVAMTIRVPDANPSNQEFYYVLLSVWDSAGSYDQVGFTNDYGTWGLTYSYTSSCAGTYYYNPAAFTLTRGTTYTFTMNLSGAGGLTFAAKAGTKYVYSLTKNSGGTYFLDQSYYSCSGTSYYDYTDYEESYSVVQPMPSFDYFFKTNTQDNASVKAWSSMGSPPGGGTIVVSGSQVEVENEPFTVNFATGFAHAVKLPNGTTTYVTSIVIAKLGSSTNVTLKLFGPSAFSASFAPSSGAPGFTSNVTLSIGAVTHGAKYMLNLRATNGSSVYTYVTLAVTVL